MSIYQPYFYIIQDVRNGMYYAGAKWGKNANPSNFMTEGGYTTSSNIVNELIIKHGLNNFIVRKIRKFKTRSEVYDYETRFLQKIDARNNQRFYNRHNNDYDKLFGSKSFSILMMERYGVSSYTQTEEFKEKAKLTKSEKYGDENYNNRYKKRLTNFERYGDENYNNRYKKRLTNFEIYGDGKFVNVEKRINTNTKKYGCNAPIQNAEVMSKLENTNTEKHGAKYYVQTKEFKEKRSEVYEKKVNRAIVSDIKALLSKNNMTLFQGWYQQSDDKLEIILSGVKELSRKKKEGLAKEDLNNIDIGFKFRFK